MRTYFKPHNNMKENEPMNKPIKIQATLNIEVDQAAWAIEYGLSSEDREGITDDALYHLRAVLGDIPWFDQVRVAKILNVDTSQEHAPMNKGQFTIDTLAQRLGYTQSPATPLPFIDWYAGYRGDLTQFELARLTGDSPVELDVAAALIREWERGVEFRGSI